MQAVAKGVADSRALVVTEAESEGWAQSLVKEEVVEFCSKPWPL